MFLAALCALAGRGGSAEEIRIEVLRGRPRAALAAAGAALLSGPDGVPLEDPGRPSHELRARQGELLLDGRPVRQP
ncbi:MAG TPA: hypothetical protein VN883_03270, partial [Myxococcales bacterium]|nr:hypothetical protein [Myxococcales bacterium]